MGLHANFGFVHEAKGPGRDSPPDTGSTVEPKMTMTAQPKTQGRIEGALTRLFMKEATVTEIGDLDAHFRLVTLKGDSLRGVRWTPGQKVQVALGGWVYRTYTPLCWDADEGRTQLLVFLHGPQPQSPASAWGRALKPGDACTLLGPRDSLDLSALARPGLLFGDETSFALAHALRFTAQGANDVRLLFEVTSKSAAEQVLGKLGISFAALVERTANDAHLSELEQLAADQIRARAIESCALSGKAPSIARLNKRLRAQGLSGRQLRTRAYWAPGKVGLD